VKKLPLPVAIKGIALATCIFSQPLFAELVIEETTIYDSKIEKNHFSVDVKNSSAADSAEMLRTIPGANINTLGGLSGIAQYRGLYGDRVSISLDGSPLFSGGPNAMDAPLSYAPTGMIKELKIIRGIASVSSAQESVGGHISAKLNRGDFSNDGNLDSEIQLDSQYRSVNHATNTTLRTTLANDHHKTTLLGNFTDSDDMKYGDGTIDSTAYERSRYDLSYGYKNEDTSLLVYGGKNNTEPSGTPALPMDIKYIDTNMAGLNISQVIGDITFISNLSYSDVKHGMDNFSFRTPPMMGMSYRNNEATAKHLAGDLKAQIPLADGTLTSGIDYSHKDQDSTITNPNNGMFEIVNFNDIEREITGIFSEWEGQFDDWNIYAGARHNRVAMDADEVGAFGVMGTMGNLANMLSMEFNNSDRSLDFSYTDFVLKGDFELSANTVIDIGIGRKHRAPSYQESYLWLPLPSAGGLADGRSYIGNLQLDEEQSDEITLGLTWQDGDMYMTPQVFYRDIKDYIQGTPTDNMAANMVGSMMSGSPALQFNNVDAKLYGVDSAYGYQFSDNWQIDGVLSYVRAKRKDTSDNLYRIAPLNHRISLQYQQDDWKVQLESVLYAKQDKVSSYNNEQKTAGYGLVNLRSDYQISPNFLVSGGVENLFDNSYQDHLAGYNRVRNSDVALGERLYGSGRNLYVAIQLKM